MVIDMVDIVEMEAMQTEFDRQKTAAKRIIKRGKGFQPPTTNPQKKKKINFSSPN